MRTTLTIDDGVAAKLKARSAASRRSLKEVVNEALRRGLLAEEEAAGEAPFEVHATRLGLRPGLSYDNVAELLERTT